MAYEMTIRDERLWHGDSTLHGSRIVSIPTFGLLRARVKRDAYDYQCHAIVETWCAGRGWREVQVVPITDLPVHACSYVSKPDTWHDPMRASLQQLCVLGITILKTA